MAVTLSNMVTKKDWETKYWKNNTETLDGTDIQSFMYHYGNEDIEVHDMSMNYGDANVCRYAIGHHDVILRRGKVNNKARNVITVAIGEIPAKTAELTANLYGILGDNEEYSEYHHIGYDITSSRILENVLRFADSYSGNQKVFFITGARSAGGVANLLAKKLIDTFGPSSVYGYTFNAVATINGNMIPEGSKIPNLKYAPIMNIYNDDELMVMFTSEETNMYKYGTNVHMSLSENLTSKVASAFKKVHKKKYDTLSVSKAKEFINDYLLELMEGIVYGMAGTLDLKNVFSGETNEDIQALANHWKLMYETTPNNEYYEEYNNICKLRLRGVKIDSFEDYVAYLTGANVAGITAYTPPSIPTGNNEIHTMMFLEEALSTMGKWYSENVYTYNAYATFDEDNTRNGIPVESFGKRFEHDLNRASAKAKEQRTNNIRQYNLENQTNQYNHIDFQSPYDYDLNLETFVGKAGKHAKYKCQDYENQTNDKNQNVGDDCSSFAAAVIDYMTYGDFNRGLKAKDLRIYDTGQGGILRGGYWEVLSGLGFTQHEIDENTEVSEFDKGAIILKNINSSHYEFVFKDKKTGKYKHFGWGMVKSTYNPQAYNVDNAKVNDNSDLEDYIMYIKVP